MQWVDLFYLELKCSLLLVVAGLLCLLFRRGSAAQRHMAWSLAMVGAILIPLVVFVFPQWKLPVLPEPPVAKSWIQIPVASDTPVAVEQPYAIAETAPVVDSKPHSCATKRTKKKTRSLHRSDLDGPLGAGRVHGSAIHGDRAVCRRTHGWEGPPGRSSMDATVASPTETFGYCTSGGTAGNQGTFDADRGGVAEASHHASGKRA